jgi:hypothetical protein
MEQKLEYRFLRSKGGIIPYRHWSSCNRILCRCWLTITWKKAGGIVNDKSEEKCYRDRNKEVRRRITMASVGSARIENLEASTQNEAPVSAVSWAAVSAGAFATAALFLILLALGSGIGLSLISPWSDVGLSSSGVGTGAIVWLILVQIVASAIGGYLAGRLRTKWVDLHAHEVYFRDTAHGFLVWAASLVVTALFFASAAVSMAGRTARNGATEGAVLGGNAYFVDSLFRTDRPATERADPFMRAEAGLILAHATTLPDIPQPDKTYLATVIARTTGLSQAEAERRVSNIVSAARQAADDARKATAHLLYWLFLALLIGAFCSSYAATIGGRQRDRIPA